MPLARHGALPVFDNRAPRRQFDGVLLRRSAVAAAVALSLLTFGANTVAAITLAATGVVVLSGSVGWRRALILTFAFAGGIVAAITWT